MSGQIDKVQGILLNADMIMRSRTDPDYDITAVANKYFALAESYTLEDN
jgi:hypothetical protein